MKFTSAQRDAMDVSLRHRDACVVAGPGSGKTTVLVEYFRNLVESGVDPLRILAITFTEKAANNMRERLARAFQEDPVRRGKLERAWVSTVHGFCVRLLKENAVFAGVDPEFSVADEREAWRIQQEAMAAAMEESFQKHPPGIRALIRGLSSYEFEEAVLSSYDAMRGAGVRVEDLGKYAAPEDRTREAIGATLKALAVERYTSWTGVQREQLKCAVEGAGRIVKAALPLEALQAIEEFSCNLQKCRRDNHAYDLLKQLKDGLIKNAAYGPITEYYAPQRQLLLEILGRFDHLYRERKGRAGLLDFADLEEFAVRLLEEQAETRVRVAAQFDHILMDEFQDTNGQQAKLLKLVRAPDRFYAVGDINQSIFGFRHAEPQGFRDYREEVAAGGGRMVELIDNFRSRPEILRAVDTILAGAPGIEPRSLVAGREFATPRPVAVDVMSVGGPESAEAQWVARRVLELVGEGFYFRDVALLVRNTEVLPEFTAAFDQARIPYLVNRGKGFYEAREVNDLTHLLRAIANPRDEVSLATVLRSPLVGVSEEALLDLKTPGDNLGVTLRRLEETAPGLDADDLGRLCRFRDRLAEWRARRDAVSFDRMLLEAMDDCGYPSSPNVDKFLALARDAAAHWTLDDFVEELALVRASNPREADAPPEDSANAVKVMTVHSAKGLEFPIVFVAALHKGIANRLPHVVFSREYGLGARWRNPVSGEEKGDLYEHAIREERKVRERDESHRLLYVAMTRAQEHLVLSFWNNGRRPANWAAVVAGSLGLDPGTAGDRIATYTTPDGLDWKARVLVTDRAPEILSRAPAAAQEERVEFVPPPAVAAQYDSNATVTALAKFAACPREYYLAHYLGFEGRARKLGGAGDAEDDGDLSASEFGTEVHRLLAGVEVPNPDAEAVRLAGVFRQSALGRQVARASRVEREFDFLMSVGDLVVRGQVDLWFEEGGQLAIVDYKTDSVTAAEAHRRARDYALQLRLYALALERVAGRPPDRAWLHFLRPNTAIEVDLTPSLLESPEQVVRDFLEAQEKREFPLEESERCRRCQFFKDLCPSTYNVSRETHAGVSGGRSVEVPPRAG